MTEDQLSQLWTVRGLLRLLDQCCDGKNVHRIGQYRQALMLLEGFLKEEQSDIEKLTRSREQLKLVKRQVIRLYHEWERLR